MRYPFDLTAEYRGQAPAGEFTQRDTGDTIQYSAGLRFEIELPDGDVDTHTYRQALLDQVGDFDSSTLAKGDKVQLVGFAVVGNNDKERSYPRLVAATRLTEGGKEIKPLRAAA